MCLRAVYTLLLITSFFILAMTASLRSDNKT
jgi:hypothetical protein